ncbi:unnamed protein product [Musa hybrid cultivar]
MVSIVVHRQVRPTRIGHRRGKSEELAVSGHCCRGAFSGEYGRGRANEGGGDFGAGEHGDGEPRHRQCCSQSGGRHGGTKHPVWPEMHGEPPKEPPRRRRTDFVISSKAQRAKESIKDNVNDFK